MPGFVSDTKPVELGFSIHRVEADETIPRGVQKLPFLMVQGEVTQGDGWEIETVRFETPEGKPYHGIKFVTLDGREIDPSVPDAE